MPWGAALKYWVLGRLGGFYVWLAYRTTRWEWVGREHLDEAFAQPRMIAGVWHARLALVCMLRPRGRRAVALISQSRDGEAIAQIIHATGAEAVRGSSRDPKKPDKEKGGAEASVALVTAVNEGAVVVVTPDGPRGPRMRAKSGATLISAATATPVLPVAFSVRRGKIFRSWDRFLLPWPITRGVWVFGAPIPAPDPNDLDDVELKRQALEAALTAATREADRRMGRETPEPAAPHDAPPPSNGATPAPQNVAGAP